jgi:hypothetical protein
VCRLFLCYGVDATQQKDQSVMSHKLSLTALATATVLAATASQAEFTDYQIGYLTAEYFICRSGGYESLHPDEVEIGRNFQNLEVTRSDNIQEGFTAALELSRQEGEFMFCIIAMLDNESVVQR